MNGSAGCQTRRSNATDVKWLQFQPGTQGKPLRPEEVLDRTSTPNVPIYLTSGARPAATGMPAKPAQAAAGSTLAKPSKPMGDEAESGDDAAEIADDDEPMPPAAGAGEDDQ